MIVLVTVAASSVETPASSEVVR